MDIFIVIGCLVLPAVMWWLLSPIDWSMLLEASATAAALIGATVLFVLGLRSLMGLPV